MKKRLQFCILIIAFIAQKLVAQNVSLYFDSKFKKVSNIKKAKYISIADTDSTQRILYIKHTSRIYAKGKIHPADSLTFDGKVLFKGSFDGLGSVRYYKNGTILPLLFIDKNLKKHPEHKALYYMAINENGYFYAYKINFRSPNLATDILFAIGRVTDTATLRLNGRYIQYDEYGYIEDIKKYKNGVVVPFIASTLDIQQPYDIMSIVTHTATIYSANDVEYEYQKFVKKCRNTGADGVIGVKTSLSPVGGTDTGDRQNVVIQGTTIRLKNDKKED